jgi:D-aminopeptidase
LGLYFGSDDWVAGRVRRVVVRGMEGGEGPMSAELAAAGSVPTGF